MDFHQNHTCQSCTWLCTHFAARGQNLILVGLSRRKKRPAILKNVNIFPKTVQ